MDRRWCGSVRRIAAATLLNNKCYWYCIGKKSSSYHTIQAIPRELSGNRISAKDRAQGRLPTIVLAREANTDPPLVSSKKQLLTTERKQINSLAKTLRQGDVSFFCSTTFQLHIRAGAGSSHLLDSGTVLPLRLHKHPETGQILNLVLVWAPQGSLMDVNVPIVFKGHQLSPGIIKGGWVEGVVRSVKVQGPIEKIPSKIEVDVSSLDIGNRICMGDIEVDPSLKLLNNNDKMAAICQLVSTKAMLLL